MKVRRYSAAPIHSNKEPSEMNEVPGSSFADVEEFAHLLEESNTPDVNRKQVSLFVFWILTLSTRQPGKIEPKFITRSRRGRTTSRRIQPPNQRRRGKRNPEPTYFHAF
jgi:hypothetical protein